MNILFGALLEVVAAGLFIGALIIGGLGLEVMGGRW